MPTSYTSLLGLALPVTGELSGTWGDTVNDYITMYLDAAIAGAQTINGSQTAVTLSKTTGGTLSQAGAGAAGSSQYQIINCTGNPGGLLTITAPAASKVYLVLNKTSTSQSVKIVGTGPTTGVTIGSNVAALVAWDGSDFQLIATSNAVTASSTDTLTNKTISVDNNTLSGIAASSFVLSNASGNIDGSAAQKAIPTGVVVGTTDTQTLTNKTVTNLIFDGNYTEDVFTISDGAAVDLNPSNGTIQVWTLGANRSPTASSFLAGQSMTLMIDDGTARTITWPSVTWVNNNGNAPTLKTTGYTVVALWKVSTTLYGAVVGAA